MNLFVFGLGYSALALIDGFRPRYGTVAGTVTTPEKAAALASRGIAAYVLDTERGHADPGIAAALTTASVILQSIPPEANGDPVLAAFAEAIAAAPRLASLNYLSTIGVYGDCGGAWVDAATPAAPGQARSRWRLTAEEAWRGLGERLGVPAQIFRLAGIYGPGRNALVDVAAGRARRIVSPGHLFNRIHVEDIARILMAAIAAPRPGAILDLADDEPAANAELVAHAADLLGLPPPPAIPVDQAGLSPMAASFWAESRRVSNARTKAALGLSLTYPTYREGLAALLAAGEGRRAGEGARPVVARA